jgi:hypothetical protein
MYKSARGRGAAIGAARVVINHHTSQHRVDGRCVPCDVPLQGAPSTEQEVT